MCSLAMTVSIDYSLIMNKFLHLLSSDLEEKLKSLGVEGFLDYLGDMRLQQKKSRMENLLRIANPDEALYREIMLALGYKNNKVQFLELAMILPYSEISKFNDPDTIEKALLYRAGLDKSRNGLPEDFDFSLKMNKSVWRYKGVRPYNRPDKRIKGVSKFLYKSCKDGLCRMFEMAIEKSFTKNTDQKSVRKFCTELTRLFTDIRKGAIGKSRAYEIIFNIIFPFFITYFEQKKKKQFLEFLYRVFVVHPSLQDNSVTKYMKLQFFGQNKDATSKITNNVVRYFGLIQLHNSILEDHS